MEVRVPTISYAITVCNELDEIKTLLPLLYSIKGKQDEIVILQDISKKDPELTTYLEMYTADNSDILLVQQEFKNHFADWKNLLTSYCTKDFIFQIDADEIPHKELIDTLPFLLGMNEDVDVMLVPRVNTVEGLTQDHIAKWKWNVSKFDSMIEEKKFDLDNPQDLGEYNLLKQNGLIIEESIIS